MTPDELRAALRDLGISQRWLAQRLGVPESTVSRWTNGARGVPSWLPFMLELLREVSKRRKQDEVNAVTRDLELLRKVTKGRNLLT